MATDSVNNNASATGMFTQAAGGKNGALDKDSFLLLLVTQFKHQDPLNPMEDKEFIAQLAQFSSLEQQMNTNEKMQSLIDIQNEQKMIGAASFIGKEISARGYGVAVTDDSITEIKYAVSDAMTKGYVNIYDANRQLVDTVSLGSVSPGIHDFNWDGTLTNGGRVPNGVYTVSIAGEDSAGQPVLVDVSVTGRVDAVSLYDGQQLLRLEDGRMVALSNVREIVEVKKTEPKPDPDETPTPTPTPPADETQGETPGTEGDVAA